jgi:predicted nucleic acid-binding Zn ribbon protein
MGRIGGGTEPATVAALFARWEDIAGPALAEHVRPVRLAEGVLVVAADQPAWATKTRASAGTLLARVGELTGERPGRLDVVIRRS